jgi:winged helix-turn helix protein
VAVVSMSKQEFNRLDVLLRVQSGHLRVADACVLIGLQRRQVFRLLRGLKQDGATSLLSKRRGKPSNHQLPAEVRILALSIMRERYAEFGLVVTEGSKVPIWKALSINGLRHGARSNLLIL